jgi:hypothetical protein
MRTHIRICRPTDIHAALDDLRQGRLQGAAVLIP